MEAFEDIDINETDEDEMEERPVVAEPIVQRGTKDLSVLVVEDTPRHQEAARNMLADYNVTIVGTFDQAVDALNQGVDNPTKRTYDVVLTDMFFPQGRGEMQRDKSTAQTPQDLGTYLAMYAAQKEVPYVAIVSDANHHDSAQTYAMNDLILKQTDRSTDGLASAPMKIGKRTLLFNIFGETHMGETERLTEIDNPDEYPDSDLVEKDGKVFYRERITPEGSEPVKNWAYVLEKIRQYDDIRDSRQLPLRLTQVVLGD